MSIESRARLGKYNALEVRCQSCDTNGRSEDYLLYLAPTNTPEFQAVAEDLAKLHDYLWDYGHLIYILLISRES